MNHDIKTGKLLLAEPFMVDTNFKKSVVLVADHTALEGTVGFVLNRPTNLKIDELIADFPDFKARVFYGGPVGVDTIHYVHRVGEILDGSREIGKGLYWSGDFQKLKLLISNHLVMLDDIKFFIGYSGWEAGQLDEELDHKSWVIADSDMNYVFNTKNEILWQLAMENKSTQLGVIAGLSDSTSLN